MQKHKKYCCLCNSEVEAFLPFEAKFTNEFVKYFYGIGSDVLNYWCPICHCNDRERHLYLYLTELNIFNFLKTRSVLYIAPDKRLIKKISDNKNLIIGDIDTARYQKLNIETIYCDLINMNIPDNSIEILVANHVLEHIIDYRKALLSIYNVLKSDGFAILQTPYSPVIYNHFEDPFINTPELRETYYGDAKHVRIFGMRFFEELNEQGFELHIFSHSQVLEKYDSENYGVNSRENLIMVKKKL